jgi:hypothetical protein
LSFASSSVVSIVGRCLRSVVVICVDVCVIICVARRLRRRQLRRSKHSGDRRRMLGMVIAMDRANLVRKDIESNARDSGHYYETGSSQAANDMAHLRQEHCNKQRKAIKINKKGGSQNGN